ncbi:MAG: redox-sensitive transcriptional activator SoxR [Methylocystaceae bacterium]|nr:redox-sensitive transcriptional activator SoxR [Methylocystaceae bacterium]
MSQPKKLPSVLSVGEVARRSGVAVSTLHFYETKGLIAAERSRGNQRRYARDVLRRLSIIRVAIDLGFTLVEITELLKPIPPGVTPSAQDVKNMIEGWRHAINQRIEGLALLRDNLDGCIGCGCLSKDDCPLRNPDDSLSSQGAGAVLLTKQTSR